MHGGGFGGKLQRRHFVWRDDVRQVVYFSPDGRTQRGVIVLGPATVVRVVDAEEGSFDISIEASVNKPKRVFLLRALRESDRNAWLQFLAATPPVVHPLRRWSAVMASKRASSTGSRRSSVTLPPAESLPDLEAIFKRVVNLRDAHDAAAVRSDLHLRDILSSMFFPEEPPRPFPDRERCLYLLSSPPVPPLLMADPCPPPPYLFLSPEVSASITPKAEALARRIFDMQQFCLRLSFDSTCDASPYPSVDAHVPVLEQILDDVAKKLTSRCNLPETASCLSNGGLERALKLQRRCFGLLVKSNANFGGVVASCRDSLTSKFCAPLRVFFKKTIESYSHLVSKSCAKMTREVASVKSVQVSRLAQDVAAAVPSARAELAALFGTAVAADEAIGSLLSPCRSEFDVMIGFLQEQRRELAPWFEIWNPIYEADPTHGLKKFWVGDDQLTLRRSFASSDETAVPLKEDCATMAAAIKNGANLSASIRACEDVAARLLQILVTAFSDSGATSQKARLSDPKAESLAQRLRGVGGTLKKAARKLLQKQERLSRFSKKAIDISFPVELDRLKGILKREAPLYVAQFVREGVSMMSKHLQSIELLIRDPPLLSALFASTLAHAASSPVADVVFVELLAADVNIAEFSWVNLRSLLMARDHVLSVATRALEGAGQVVGPSTLPLTWPALGLSKLSGLSTSFLSITAVALPGNCIATKCAKALTMATALTPSSCTAPELSLTAPHLHKGLSQIGTFFCALFPALKLVRAKNSCAALLAVAEKLSQSYCALVRATQLESDQCAKTLSAVGNGCDPKKAIHDINASCSHVKKLFQELVKAGEAVVKRPGVAESFGTCARGCDADADEIEIFMSYLIGWDETISTSLLPQLDFFYRFEAQFSVGKDESSYAVRPRPRASISAGPGRRQSVPMRAMTSPTVRGLRRQPSSPSGAVASKGFDAQSLFKNFRDIIEFTLYRGNYPLPELVMQAVDTNFSIVCSRGPLYASKVEAIRSQMSTLPFTSENDIRATLSDFFAKSFSSRSARIREMKASIDTAAAEVPNSSLESLWRTLESRLAAIMDPTGLTAATRRVGRAAKSLDCRSMCRIQSCAPIFDQTMSKMSENFDQLRIWTDFCGISSAVAIGVELFGDISESATSLQEPVKEDDDDVDDVVALTQRTLQELCPEFGSVAIPKALVTQEFPTSAALACAWIVESMKGGVSRLQNAVRAFETAAAQVDAALQSEMTTCQKEIAVAREKTFSLVEKSHAVLAATYEGFCTDFVNFDPLEQRRTFSEVVSDTWHNAPSGNLLFPLNSVMTFANELDSLLAELYPFPDNDFNNCRNALIQQLLVVTLDATPADDVALDSDVLPLDRAPPKRKAGAGEADFFLRGGSSLEAEDFSKAAVRQFLFRCRSQLSGALSALQNISVCFENSMNGNLAPDYTFAALKRALEGLMDDLEEGVKIYRRKSRKQIIRACLDISTALSNDFSSVESPDQHAALTEKWSKRIQSFVSSKVQPHWRGGFAVVRKQKIISKLAKFVKVAVPKLESSAMSLTSLLNSLRCAHVAELGFEQQKNAQHRTFSAVAVALKGQFPQVPAPPFASPSSAVSALKDFFLQSFCALTREQRNHCMAKASQVVRMYEEIALAVSNRVHFIAALPPPLCESSPEFLQKLVQVAEIDAIVEENLCVYGGDLLEALQDLVSVRYASADVETPVDSLARFALGLPPSDGSSFERAFLDEKENAEIPHVLVTLITSPTCWPAPPYAKATRVLSSSRSPLWAESFSEASIKNFFNMVRARMKTAVASLSKSKLFHEKELSNSFKGVMEQLEQLVLSLFRQYNDASNAAQSLSRDVMSINQKLYSAAAAAVRDEHAWKEREDAALLSVSCLQDLEARIQETTAPTLDHLVSLQDGFNDLFYFDPSVHLRIQSESAGPMSLVAVAEALLSHPFSEAERCEKLEVWFSGLIESRSAALKGVVARIALKQRRLNTAVAALGKKAGSGSSEKDLAKAIQNVERRMEKLLLTDAIVVADHPICFFFRELVHLILPSVPQETRLKFESAATQVASSMLAIDTFVFRHAHGDFCPLSRVSTLISPPLLRIQVESLSCSNTPATVVPSEADPDVRDFVFGKDMTLSHTAERGESFASSLEDGRVFRSSLYRFLKEDFVKRRADVGLPCGGNNVELSALVGWSNVEIEVSSGSLRLAKPGGDPLVLPVSDLLLVHALGDSSSRQHRLKLLCGSKAYEVSFASEADKIKWAIAIIEATSGADEGSPLVMEEKHLVDFVSSHLSFFARRSVNMITRFLFDFWFGRSSLVDLPPPSLALEKISVKEEKRDRGTLIKRSSFKFGAYAVTMFLSPEEHPHADTRKAVLCVRWGIDVPQPKNALEMLSGGSQDVYFTIQIGIVSHKSADVTVTDGAPLWIPLDGDPSNDISTFEFEFSQSSSIAIVSFFRKRATGNDVRLALVEIDLWDAVRLERNETPFNSLSSVQKMRDAFEGVDVATMARAFEGKPMAKTSSKSQSLTTRTGRALAKLSKGLFSFIKKKQAAASSSESVTPIVVPSLTCKVDFDAVRAKLMKLNPNNPELVHLAAHLRHELQTTSSSLSPKLAEGDIVEIILGCTQRTFQTSAGRTFNWIVAGAGGKFGMLADDDFSPGTAISIAKSFLDEFNDCTVVCETILRPSSIAFLENLHASTYDIFDKYVESQASLVQDIVNAADAFDFSMEFDPKGAGSFSDVVVNWWETVRLKLDCDHALKKVSKEREIVASKIMLVSKNKDELSNRLLQLDREIEVLRRSTEDERRCLLTQVSSLVRQCFSLDMFVCKHITPFRSAVQPLLDDLKKFNLDHFFRLKPVPPPRAASLQSFLLSYGDAQVPCETTLPPPVAAALLSPSKWIFDSWFAAASCGFRHFPVSFSSLQISEIQSVQLSQKRSALKAASRAVSDLNPLLSRPLSSLHGTATLRLRRLLADIGFDLNLSSIDISDHPRRDMLPPSFDGDAFLLSAATVFKMFSSPGIYKEGERADAVLKLMSLVYLANAPVSLVCNFVVPLLLQHSISPVEHLELLNTIVSVVTSFRTGDPSTMTQAVQVLCQFLAWGRAADDERTRDAMAGLSAFCLLSSLTNENLQCSLRSLPSSSTLCNVVAAVRRASDREESVKRLLDGLSIISKLRSGELAADDGVLLLQKFHADFRTWDETLGSVPAVEVFRPVTYFASAQQLFEESFTFATYKDVGLWAARFKSEGDSQPFEVAAALASVVALTSPFLSFQPSSCSVRENEFTTSWLVQLYSAIFVENNVSNAFNLVASPDAPWPRLLDFIMSFGWHLPSSPPPSLLSCVNNLVGAVGASRLFGLSSLSDGQTLKSSLLEIFPPLFERLCRGALFSTEQCKVVLSVVVAAVVNQISNNFSPVTAAFEFVVVLLKEDWSSQLGSVIAEFIVRIYRLAPTDAEPLGAMMSNLHRAFRSLQSDVPEEEVFIEFKSLLKERGQNSVSDSNCSLKAYLMSLLGSQLQILNVSDAMFEQPDTGTVDSTTYLWLAVLCFWRAQLSTDCVVADTWIFHLYPVLFSTPEVSKFFQKTYPGLIGERIAAYSDCFESSSVHPRAYKEFFDVSVKNAIAAKMARTEHAHAISELMLSAIRLNLSGMLCSEWGVYLVASSLCSRLPQESHHLGLMVHIRNVVRHYGDYVRSLKSGNAMSALKCAFYMGQEVKQIKQLKPGLKWVLLTACLILQGVVAAIFFLTGQGRSVLNFIRGSLPLFVRGSQLDPVKLPSLAYLVDSGCVEGLAAEMTCFGSAMRAMVQMERCIRISNYYEAILCGSKLAFCLKERVKEFVGSDEVVHFFASRVGPKRGSAVSFVMKNLSLCIEFKVKSESRGLLSRIGAVKNISQLSMAFVDSMPSSQAIEVFEALSRSCAAQVPFSTQPVKAAMVASANLKPLAAVVAGKMLASSVLAKLKDGFSRFTGSSKKPSLLKTVAAVKGLAMILLKDLPALLAKMNVEYQSEKAEVFLLYRATRACVDSEVADEDGENSVVYSSLVRDALAPVRSRCCASLSFILC